MLIIHGTVHTMDGPAIDNGFVAIREGKIWKVGPMEECPADWKGETLDARGGTSCLASWTLTATWGCSGTPWALRGTTATRPPTPAPPTCGPSTE